MRVLRGSHAQQLSGKRKVKVEEDEETTKVSRLNKRTSVNTLTILLVWLLALFTSWKRKFLFNEEPCVSFVSVYHTGIKAKD